MQEGIEIKWTCPKCKSENTNMFIEIISHHCFCTKFGCEEIVIVTCDVEVKNIKVRSTY